MRNVVYDIETFPNFFSVCFYDLDAKEYTDFVIHEETNELEAIKEYWTNTNWKIGYNNVKFDDVIMRFIMGGSNVTPFSINQISQLIIETQKLKEPLYAVKQLKNYLRPYDNSIDLMKIHALHKIGVSLKQVGVVLNHPTLQDLPKDPYANVYPHEIKDMLKYGRNDVEITKKLFDYSKKDIALRSSIGKLYGVNVLSESRTYIAKKILDKYYQEFTHSNLKDFKDLRSYYTTIPLRGIIKKFNFRTEALIDLYERMLNIVVDNDYKFYETVKTKGMVHQLGLGGLHSKNKNEVYEEDDEYCLIDVDFASYYPNLMLKYKLYPKHLKPEFLKVLKTLTEQRLNAKKIGDKLTADTLKISINSLFGLLGFDQYWLKDDRLMYSVTVNGQLLLLGVIEYLERLGDVTCIYSNTDGATFKVRRELKDEVITAIDKLTEFTGIELEHVEYKKMIVRDVNNYLIVKDNDEVKRKGIFLYEQDITKGFRMPIVQKALYEYYVNNIPIADTINNEVNIYLFCIAQRTGKQFKTFFRTIEGLEPLQKTNRYFVSTKSGSLIKVKHKDDGTLQENQAIAGENVYILNDYDSENLEYYLSIVKRSYYMQEANKIVNSFNVDQYSLF